MTELELSRELRFLFPPAVALVMSSFWVILGSRKLKTIKQGLSIRQYHPIGILPTVENHATWKIMEEGIPRS